jgi:aspartyl-tRNA(Asn)/glutamyl-tRNA(Gln) amidotransferase subunit A
MTTETAATRELAYLSATDALAAFRSRELSPIELLDAVLARAEAVEPDVNALTAVRRESAYAAAREAEARYLGRGGEPRALEGLPVAVKEEQPIAGESLVLGSLTMEGYVSPETHPVVERIAEAGGVIHARTATPEFSAAGFTHSRVWGVSRNPWNLDCATGGSSGGAGASLASGTTILATGSDIGGSIRIPSSFNGVIGYKPPYGRVPGLPPFNLDTYCHDGPMARTVADVALLENVIAGHHAADEVSLPKPAPVSGDGASIAGRRIAWARTLGDYPVEREIAEATERVAGVLAALGAEVEEVTIPVTMDMIMDATLVHFGAIFGPSIDEVALGREELLMPYIQKFRVQATEAFQRVGYYDGLKLESEIATLTGAALAGFDAVVMPTLTTLGLTAGDDYVDKKVTVDGVELPFYLQTALTPLFNVLSRRPVLAVPSGIASNGVPMGVQIAGQPFDDQPVFDIAAALESVERWWSRPDWRPGLGRA